VASATPLQIDIPKIAISGINSHFN